MVADRTPGEDETVLGGGFLVSSEVAARLRCSLRTIHELTRTCAVPHRKLPGSRKCLFRVAELEAWEDGTPLAVVELPRGGRIVYPRNEKRVG